MNYQDATESKPRRRFTAYEVDLVAPPQGVYHVSSPTYRHHTCKVRVTQTPNGYESVCVVCGEHQRFTAS